MAEENLKYKTRKGYYWKFLELFANQFMQFVIGIFMARMLSPEDYGLTAIPAVFMAVAGLFASAGFGQAMVRKQELKEEDLSTAFYYSLGMGVLIYILFFFSSPWVADFYNAPILCPMIRVTALGFIYGPINTPQNIILERRLDFKTPTKIGLLAKILYGITGVALAFYGYGVWALVLSTMFGGIVGMIMKCYVVRWYPKTGWSKDSFRYLWGYGNKFMASQIINTLYGNITPLFIGKYYSPSNLGVYNRADGYANLPSSTLTGVIQSVSFPILSKIQDDENRLAHNYQRLLKSTVFVVFPCMMLLAALAHPLIVTLITKKWESCVILLQILCFSKMWYPVHAINLNLLLVKGRTDWFLKLEVIKKCYGIIILLGTLPLGLIVFCAGSIFSSIIGLVVNTYYTGKLINMGFWKQMRDFLPILLLSMFMFLVVYCITLIIPNDWGQIVIGGIVGVALYLGVSYLFKFEEIEDLKYMLNIKKTHG